MEEYLQAQLAAVLDCPVKWGFFEDGGEIPSVTIVHVSGRRERTYTTSGLKRVRIQFDCWGTTYLEALTSSRTIEDLLEGFSGGPIKSATLSTVRGGDSGDAAAAHRVSLTYSLTYQP